MGVLFVTGSEGMSAQQTDLRRSEEWGVCVWEFTMDEIRTARQNRLRNLLDAPLSSSVLEEAQ